MSRYVFCRDKGIRQGGVICLDNLLKGMFVLLIESEKPASAI